MIPNNNQKTSKLSIFDIKIDNVSMRDAVSWIIKCAKGTQKVTAQFVNADCLNKAYTDLQYKKVLRKSRRVFGDGSGILLASKLKKKTIIDNVNGTDLFPLLCEQLQKHDIKIFLLGARPNIAKRVQQTMQKRYPNVQFVGEHNGYFDSKETDTVIAKINQSDANILLVAFGAPYQEIWIDRHHKKITANVCIGVGGLFDFYSGRISRAPVWLRRLGCEWMWRLLQEPKRLWKRYLIGNGLFIMRVIREVISEGMKKRSKKRMRLDASHHSTKLNPALNNNTTFTKQKRYLWQLKSKLKPVVKRSLDITISGLALVILLPLLILTIIAIRSESTGSAFFKQTRVGMLGKPFNMWKFRSMYIDAEQRKQALMSDNEMQGGVLFKMKQDPRITRVGKVIRKLSIDELPQLWNVLKGDMSLVGPRPALPNEVNTYSIHERKRLAAKPGITCIWQVSGRSEIPFIEQVEMDRRYIAIASFKADILLLIKTIPAILTGKGAY